MLFTAAPALPRIASPEIAHAVANEAEVDDELRYPIEIVSRSPL
jgi:hypothetical protein